MPASITSIYAAWTELATTTYRQYASKTADNV